MEHDNLEEPKDLDELDREIADHEAKLEALRAEREKARQAKLVENVERVQRLMEELGVSWEDFKPAESKSTTKPKKAAKNPSGAVEPKYKDPTTGETWSGRGRLPPKWITAYEANGRKREEFLIKP